MTYPAMLYRETRLLYLLQACARLERPNVALSTRSSTHHFSVPSLRIYVTRMLLSESDRSPPPPPPSKRCLLYARTCVCVARVCAYGVFCAAAGDLLLLRPRRRRRCRRVSDLTSVRQVAPSSDRVNTRASFDRNEKTFFFF